MLKQALRLPVNIKVGSDFKTLFQVDDFTAPVPTAHKNDIFIWRNMDGVILLLNEQSKFIWLPHCMVF